jgi:hypothetical protein
MKVGPQKFGTPPQKFLECAPLVTCYRYSTMVHYRLYTIKFIVQLSKKSKSKKGSESDSQIILVDSRN